jgi:hypothetical protein
MRTLLLFILVALAAATTFSSGAGAQKVPPKELTVSEKALVAGSREAIIKTGISAAFFDAHFRLARVIDLTGDRRVMWRLSVGGYETTINDSIGYYTEGMRRVDTHSVATTLATTNDITRTITRRRAELLMRRCIGRFQSPQVEYRAHGAEGRAALLLTAFSLVPRREEHEREGRGREARERREKEEREREERERRERAQRTGGAPVTDEIEAEDEEGEGPVVVLGAVDLVTGECSVGYGQSGPVPPQPARPIKRQK